jgi:hypothetical protein
VYARPFWCSRVRLSCLHQGADGKCAPDAVASQGGAAAAGRGRSAQQAEFDAQCAQLVPNSEFDGVSDCRCKQGFNQVGNSCVPAGGAAAGVWGNAAAAPHAAGAAGAASAAGAAGQFSAAQVEQYNQQCQQLKGPYWAFDGVDDCTCAPGAQLVGNDCYPMGGGQAAAAGSGTRTGAGGWGGGASAMAGGGGWGGGGTAAAAAGAGAGAGGGMATRGAGAAAAQQESVKERNDKLCRDRFGPGAEVWLSLCFLPVVYCSSLLSRKLACACS